mmetsp:Transcript_88689/g.246299  ORF Transcript_88689/g.246299 Transcript_88689/m.246299 type:complete len:287 (+) Transcript_88689:127-987(+)
MSWKLRKSCRIAGSLYDSHHQRPPQPRKDQAGPATGRPERLVVSFKSNLSLTSSPGPGSALPDVPRASQATQSLAAEEPTHAKPPSSNWTASSVCGSCRIVSNGGKGAGRNDHESVAGSAPSAALGQPPRRPRNGGGAPNKASRHFSAAQRGSLSARVSRIATATSSGLSVSRGQPRSTGKENVEQAITSACGLAPAIAAAAIRVENCQLMGAEATGGWAKLKSKSSPPSSPSSSRLPLPFSVLGASHRHAGIGGSNALVAATANPAAAAQARRQAQVLRRLPVLR